jgi:hypothetical protein
MDHGLDVFKAQLRRLLDAPFKGLLVTADRLQVHANGNLRHVRAPPNRSTERLRQGTAPRSILPYRLGMGRRSGQLPFAQNDIPFCAIAAETGKE